MNKREKAINNRRGSLLRTDKEGSEAIYVEDFREIFYHFFNCHKNVSLLSVARRALTVAERKAGVEPRLPALKTTLNDNRRSYVPLDQAQRWIRCVVYELHECMLDDKRRTSNKRRADEMAIAKSAVRAARRKVECDVSSCYYVMSSNEDYSTKEVADIDLVRKVIDTWMSKEVGIENRYSRKYENADRLCGFSRGITEFIMTNNVLTTINHDLMVHICRALVGMDNYPTAFQRRNDFYAPGTYRYHKKKSYAR